MLEFENIEHHKDEAERLGAQVANAYNKGFLNNLKKADKVSNNAFKARYEAIKYQLEFGVITEEEYYKRLEAARDKYFGRNTQEWHKYTAEIYEYRKSVIEEYGKYVQENFDELLKITEKGREQFAKLQSDEKNYAEKLSDYAGSKTGFDTHVTYVDNYWPTGDPLKMVDYALTDYDAEIKKLQEFNDAITALKDRAQNIEPEIFSMYFDDIRNMSVDDAKILTDLLLAASEEDFKKQFELYNQKNELMKNMASSLYYDDYEKLSKDIRTELQLAFADMPSDFFKYGEVLAKGFASGFIEEVDSFFESVKVEMPQIEPAAQNTNNVQNTQFSPVYYFYGDRASTSRTRITAKNDALFNYMRGMY